MNKLIYFLFALFFCASHCREYRSLPTKSLTMPSQNDSLIWNIDFEWGFCQDTVSVYLGIDTIFHKWVIKSIGEYSCISFSCEQAENGKHFLKTYKSCRLLTQKSCDCAVDTLALLIQLNDSVKKYKIPITKMPFLGVSKSSNLNLPVLSAYDKRQDYY